MDKLKDIIKLDVNNVFFGNILPLVPELKKVVFEEKRELELEKPVDIQIEKSQVVIDGKSQVDLNQEIENKAPHSDNSTIEKIEPTNSGKNEGTL